MTFKSFARSFVRMAPLVVSIYVFIAVAAVLCALAPTEVWARWAAFGWTVFGFWAVVAALNA